MAVEDEATPVLTQAQLARIAAYGHPHEVYAGTVLFQAGDNGSDFVLLGTATVEIVRAARPDEPEDVVATHGPGRFIGELNLLTGQAAYLTARVIRSGLIHRVPQDGFRRLMHEDPDLSDVILRALLSRRRHLQAGPAARTLLILGSALSANALALRTYAARQRLPHTWVDFDSTQGTVLVRSLAVSATDLPVVVTATTTLIRATPRTLADSIGLSYRPDAAEVVDLVVVGAGPAGLAAAVYGASEGLSTLLLDAVAAGGQAAASSRIENYLGFTSGISGADLTGRATVQAQKFGARIASPCPVAALERCGHHLQVVLGDGATVPARSVVIASGARYRSLPLGRWGDFEGAGIYYAATDLEAKACSPHPVAIVGGANSAGQAALYLAARGSTVALVVRGPDLAAGMSSYLADRILAHPQITVRTATEVSALHGTDHLDGITLRNRGDGTELAQPCRGLFCFIGALPATSWLSDVILDEDGFVLTDTRLSDNVLGVTWRVLGRRPLPFETSQPAVFAVGDVRSGSMKRVAAAVGEGASAIRSVHIALGVHAT